MPDKESVITHLQIISTWASFARERDLQFFTEKHLQAIELWARDALALLKEQEAIPCGEKIKGGDVVLDFYKCGYCNNAIRKPWRYCPFCGKEVKWDGSDRKTLVRK